MSATTASEELWLIPPPGQRPAVDSATGERDLIARFGAASVAREDAQIGEGETLPVTVLFPADSARRLEVFWRDTVARTRPSSLRLMGSRSEWRVHPGVTLGTTLAEVERLNGRPFTLAGFHWDYAGSVMSFEGGRLDSLPPGVEQLIVRLDPGGTTTLSPAADAQVSGDRPFPSTHPVMRELNPRVSMIEVRLR